MKHIKLRIIATIWLSAFLLLAVCEVILNWSVPRHFEKEAVNSIKEQIIFADALNDFIKDENGDFPEEPDTYFGGEIQYISVRQLTFENASNDTDNGSDGANDDTFDGNLMTSSPKTDKNTEEYELVNYLNSSSFPQHEIQKLKTKNGYYVFTTYTEYFPDDGDYLYIMYINLKHVFTYTKTLNIILVCFYIAVSCVMSIPGYYLAKKIQESQETQRRFFQNTSHELKTPLMTVQGYAEGIQTGVTDPKKAADVILQESDRMTHIVSELLSLSKIDMHSLKPNLVRIDLREVLYDSLREAEPLVERRGITLTPELPDSPVWINGDEDMLERVFTNILSNGIRHCEHEVKIICTAYSRFVTVKFRDDGSGIDEKDLPHIFDRFYTGENGSTGIGLALAQELVRLHGGTLTAYNDNGAVFAVKFFYS